MLININENFFGGLSIKLNRKNLEKPVCFISKTYQDIQNFTDVASTVFTKCLET